MDKGENCLNVGKKLKTACLTCNDAVCIAACYIGEVRQT